MVIWVNIVQSPESLSRCWRVQVRHRVFERPCRKSGDPRKNGWIFGPRRMGSATNIPLRDSSCLSFQMPNLESKRISIGSQTENMKHQNLYRTCSLGSHWVFIAISIHWRQNRVPLRSRHRLGPLPCHDHCVALVYDRQHQCLGRRQSDVEFVVFRQRQYRAIDDSRMTPMPCQAQVHEREGRKLSDSVAAGQF